MLTALILSKDRPPQLKALLDSIQHNKFSFLEPVILFDYSDKDFKKGYDKVFRKHGGWIYTFKQTGELSNSFKMLMKLVKTKYICFLTDDTLFYNSPGGFAEQNRLDIIDGFDNDTLCFSLRMGLNTVLQDYKTGRLQPELANYEMVNGCGNRVIRWNYNEYDCLNNYGYPISLDGHVYLTGDIQNITGQIEFTEMRAWEGLLALDKRYLYNNWKPKMAAFKKSVCVNIPANEVLGGLYASDKFCSLKEMNELFINGALLDEGHKGRHIDIYKMNFSKVIGCHQEIPYVWSKS